MIRLLTLGAVALQSFAPITHNQIQDSDTAKDKRVASAISYREIYDLKQEAVTHVHSALPWEVSGAVSRYTVEGWLNRIPDIKWQGWINDMNAGVHRNIIYDSIIQTIRSGTYGSEGQWYMDIRNRLEETNNRIETLQMISNMATDSTTKNRLNSYIAMLESKKYDLINGPAWNWQGLGELNGLATNIQGIDPSLFNQLMEMQLNGSIHWDYSRAQGLVNSLVQSRDFIKLFGKGIGSLTKLQQIFMFVVSGVLAIMSALMAWLFMRNRKIKASKGIKVFIASTGSVFLTVAASLLVIALI